MKVSAILPTYNDEKTIKKCIKSILKIPELKELIIINDNSSDNTENIIKIIKSKKIKYYKNKKNLGTSKTKNNGAKKAEGNIIFFAEGDAYYNKNYLKYCLKYFKDKKIGGVIPNIGVWNKKSILTSLYKLEKKLKSFNYKPISAWVIKKKIFKKLKGYDENLKCGEDVDLGDRIKQLGYKIAYEPKILWHHKEPETLLKLIKRNIWQGEYGDEIYKKYKKINKGRIIDLIFFIGIIIAPFSNGISILSSYLIYLISKYKIIIKSLKINLKIGLIFPFYLLLKRISVFIGVIKRLFYKYIKVFK